MSEIIHPGKCVGTLEAPASKSQFQRAVAIACVSKQNQTIIAKKISDDCGASLSIASSLGAEIVAEGEQYLIAPGIFPRKSEIFCGESALSMRLFSAVASVNNKSTTLIAEGSLKNRPFSMIIEPLKQLGVAAHISKGSVRIDGSLHSGEVVVDACITAQFLSGLLIALPVLDGDSFIKVLNLNSTPYVNVTLKMLTDFGIEIEQKNLEEFQIKGNQTYRSSRIVIEGDWSSAAVFFIAGAMTGEISISGLNEDSLQADKSVLSVLEMIGAYVRKSSEGITVKKNQLKSFFYDATNSPDLFPVLAALATQCEGVSRIKGIYRLHHKESDRAKCIVNEFLKLGVDISVKDDEMIISKSKIKDFQKVSSCNDHRIAFSLALLGLVSEQGTHIDDSECVSKSYPGFYEDLKAVYQSGTLYKF